MKTETLRFGVIEVEEERVIHFPDGILGFPENKDFVIMEHKPDSPFMWLQSMSTPELAFVITNPFLVKPDYLDNLTPGERAFFSTENGNNLTIFVLVTIPPGQVEKMTVNLLGPLAIDIESRTGKQVILPNSGYHHRYPLGAS
ncbi:flagellar assembly protein FliW [Thermodesulfobacteriota bacterium]